MATDTDSATAFGRVSRWRERVLRVVLLASALAGVLSLAALLVYVSYQAFNVATAPPTWLLVYGLTLVAPTAATLWYLRSRSDALPVGTESLLVLWAGAMAAGGAGIFFVAVEPVTWFATAVPVALAAAVAIGLVRYTPLSEGVRIVATAVVLGLGLFGVPGAVPSLAGLIGSLAVLPSDFVIVVVSLVVPVGAVVGAYVAARADRRAGLLGGAAAVVGVAAVGYAAALVTGFSPGDAVLIPLFGLLPTAVHAWRTLATDDRPAVGLALPLVIVGGALLGAALVSALGVDGPASWVDWQFLTSFPSASFPEEAGVFPSIVGSLLLMIVVVVLAFPVGVGAAVYLEEYAADSRFTRFVQVNISNLAGVPSVVYGLLGLAVFVNTFAMPSGSVLVGGLALGLLILPIVIISAQEAIRSVPETAREASYGMGATRWQTVRRVVLPQAAPGILTGTILALGRAIGETAPLIMIAAPTSYLGVPDGFFAPAAALPLQIYGVAFRPQEAFQAGIVPAGVVTMLVVLLTMNGIAIVLRNRYQNDT